MTPLDIEGVSTGIADAPDLGCGTGAQDDQVNIADALVIETQTGDTVGRRGDGQRQVEHANAVGNNGVAEHPIAVWRGAKDERQVLAAQLEARCRGQTRQALTGMAGPQHAVGVEQVKPTLARGRDDQAERGRIVIGQEGEGRRTALDADEGRRHQNFAIGGFGRCCILDRLFRRWPAGGQDAERCRYKERSPQGPRTAKVRPGQR